MHTCMKMTLSFYQHMDDTGIENVLNKEYANVCEWFVDNKLSVHFGQDESKCIHFSREKTCRSLMYVNNRTKQFRI